MKNSFEKTFLAATMSALLIGSVFVTSFTMSQVAFAQVADDPAAADSGSSDQTSSSASSNSTSIDDSSSDTQDTSEDSTSSENSEAANPGSNSTDTSTEDSSASSDTNSTSSESSPDNVSNSTSTVPAAGDDSTSNSTANGDGQDSLSPTADANSTSSEPNPIALTSDKQDYSPGEIAFIRGSGFEPETSYDLYVFRGDGWIVRGNGEEGFDTIMADSNGMFAYSYELSSVDGDWMVLVYESSDTELNNLIAELVFQVNAPTLSTDKFDYDPADTATISGKGFRPGESYDIVIERPDGTIITGDGTFTEGFDTVNANSNGRFAYSYILNGIPGAYQIYAYRASDESHVELIARGGFADANTGPLYGGTATSSTWLNPTRAQGAADNSCASSGGNNNILDIMNFGFTSSMVPAGATITAIKVEVDSAAVNSATREFDVQLLKGGASIAGSNIIRHTLADGGSNPCGLLPIDNFTTITPATPTWNAGLTQADVISSGFGVRIQNANGGAVRVVDSVKVTVTFETSISWEKRLEPSGTLNGPATFEVSPDPSDGVGIMTVVDNGANDADTDIGQLKVNNVMLNAYVITEITPASGTALDDDTTRSITVSTSELNPVVGTQGVDDAGNSDESDFHNRLGSIEWEKRLETGTAPYPLHGGATFTISPDPSDGIGTMTVVDNGANDTDTDAGQLRVVNARLASYTITETAAPAGSTIDNDSTRSVTVSASDLNAIIGSALGAPPGIDDAGDSDESDFHNVPITVSVTFNASPAMADVSGTTAVLTVTIGGSPTTVLMSELPKTFAGIASGTTVSYLYESPLASTTAGQQYRWSSTSGTGSASAISGQAGSFTITSVSTVTGAYLAQYQVIFAQTGLNALDTTGTVVTVGGSPKPYADLPFTSSFVDSGTVITFDYSSPVTSSVTGKQYRLDSISGGSEPSITVTSPATITGNYVEQFQVTFQQSGLLPDSTGAVVTIDAATKSHSDLPFSKFVDSGTAVAFDYSDPVASSSAGKQYRLSSIIGGSEPSVTVSASTIITGNYLEQFRVTFEQSGLDGSAVGTLVMVDTVAQMSLPFSKYVDAGSSVTYSYETLVASNAPDKRFRLAFVTGPVSPVTIEAPTTITGNYVKQFEITFQQLGLGADSTGTVVTVDGETKVRTDLPFSKFVDTGTAVTFDYSDPVTSSTSGKQYRLSSVTGGSEPSVTVTGGTIVTGNYIDQFQVAFAQTGLDSSASGAVVTVDGSAKSFAQLPFSKFVDSGTSVTFDYSDPVTSSDTNRRFTLSSITGGAEPSVVVSSNLVLTGNYQSQHKVTFDQAGLDATATGVLVNANGDDKSFADLPFTTDFIDDGSVITYLYTDPVTSAIGKQFRLDSISGPASGFALSSYTTITGNYVTQYQVTFAESGQDGFSTGTVVTVDGDAKERTDLPFSKFVDSGAIVSYSYESPVGSTISDKRFRLTDVAGPASSFQVSQAETITGNYVVQYSLTFTNTGLDSTATGTVVTVNGSPKDFDDLPLTDWFDTGSTYEYSNPVGSNSPGSSFILLDVIGQVSPITTSGEISGNYFKTIVISGMKFNDVDGDGIKESGEDGLSGWTIFIDLNDNGVLDSEETFVLTSSGGTYSLENLGPGTYKIREVHQTGWTQTTPNPSDITASSGVNVNDIDFGNFELIVISGIKFNDLDGNAAQDIGEPGLEGWTINLSPGGQTTLTDDTGAYSFGDLGPGTYSITETQQLDWMQTTADPEPIVATSGNDVSGIDFGNFRQFDISGTKFEDMNGDGTRDTEDLGLEGWTINLSQDGSPIASTLTAPDGSYSFVGLGPGEYSVSEEIESGWMQTYPSSPGTYSFDGTSGLDVSDQDFGNFELITISGLKFEDHDGDGTQDPADQGVGGWTINLDLNAEGSMDQTATTSADGTYSFPGVGPGVYRITEVQEPGWTQTTANPNDLTALSGSDVGAINFGNFENIMISGIKFEDHDGDGVQDAEDQALEGWTIQLDSGADNIVDVSDTTDSSGGYSFEDLGPGTYRIREALQSDWIQTTANPSDVIASSGVDHDDVDFGNFQLFDISGMKFEDHDGDGIKDLEDQGIESWAISLDKDGLPFASTSTDGDGSYSFVNLGPGQYTVSETADPQWTQTFPSSTTHSVTGMSAIDATEKDFGNFKNFKITGMKFEDHNGDGTQQAGDQGLESWSIFLDANNDGIKNSGEVSTLTISDGSYEFAGLGPGTYIMREELQIGWTHTTADPDTISGASGEDVSGISFGNFENFSISGNKFIDTDGDGTRDAGETSSVQSMTIQLYRSPFASVDQTTTTDASGNYQFQNLGPGTYQVREVVPSGWVQTTADPSDVVGSSGTNVGEKDFGNFKLFSISGKKFNDLDGDKTDDAGTDPGLNGWTIQLDKDANGSVDQTVVTTAGGAYSFTGLGPGTYRVTEVAQGGWTQTTPSIADIVASSGVDISNANFGNFQLVTISGKKFHDLDGDKTSDGGTDPGLSGWTIELRNSANAIVATSITDGSGNYLFTNVGPGSFTLSEVLQTGWHQTYPTKYPLPPGSHPVTTSSGTNVVAKDFGNIKARTVTGFFQPIDMNGVVNVIKNGQAVPAKFEIFIGGTEQASLSEIVGGTLVYKKISCSDLSGDPVDEVEVTNTGATALRYDSTAGQYIQNWKTPTGAGYCYSLTAYIIDGSSITAYFKTK